MPSPSNLDSVHKAGSGGVGSYFQEATLLGSAAKDCSQVVPDVHSAGGCRAADDARLSFVVLGVSGCPAFAPT